MELVEKGTAYFDNFGRTAIVEDVFGVPGLGRCVSARVIPAEDSESDSDGVYRGRVSDFMNRWKTERPSE